MPELFMLADSQVLVGVMYQFYGTSWDLSLGNKKFLMLLKYLAHTLRIDATDEQVQEYVDMVGVDMFWHVCDALWKDGKLEIPAKKDGNTHAIKHTLEFESVYKAPECHFLLDVPCDGIENCQVGGCAATDDAPPKGVTHYAE